MYPAAIAPSPRLRSGQALVRRVCGQDGAWCLVSRVRGLRLDANLGPDEPFWQKPECNYFSQWILISW
jgi:hypothetical protein